VEDLSSKHTVNVNGIRYQCTAGITPIHNMYYVSGKDRKGAEFTGNKHIHSHTLSFIYISTHIYLHSTYRLTTDDVNVLTQITIKLGQL